MGGHIDARQVRHIAHLARLKLSDEEVSRFAGQLEAILRYVEKLNELDTQHVEPTAHPLAVRDVFGDDEPRAPLRAEEALRNAPASQGGFFTVPKVLDQGGGA